MTDSPPDDASHAAKTDTSDAVLLYTPAEAARLLNVPESWLRKRAGQRLIPRTFLGRHLRFSRHDLQMIAESGARPARPTTTHRRRRGTRA